MSTTEQEHREHKTVPLSAEDLARVRRLTEEVKARLYEVGLIMSRTMGEEIVPGSARYSDHPSRENADETIEVIIVKLPDGTFCCMQDPPGVCECPC
jgi:hypothetical protein